MALKCSNPAWRIICVLLLLSGVAACSSVSITGEESAGVYESGIASFYADRHQNHKTANGERYQHHLNTAAHRTLPFGTFVKVTNLDNGKSVVVKINDRGPFVAGRIIDLSKSAFGQIGELSEGLLRVEIDRVD